MNLFLDFSMKLCNERKKIEKLYIYRFCYRTRVKKITEEAYSYRNKVVHGLYISIEKKKYIENYKKIMEQDPTKKEMVEKLIRQYEEEIRELERQVGGWRRKK